MAIPVVQLGTSNVGGQALRALITNPEFELTGVWVSSDAKAGKDAAELVGLEDPTGVKASPDLDAVLATGPQCAVYSAMADNPSSSSPWKTLPAKAIRACRSTASIRVCQRPAAPGPGRHLPEHPAGTPHGDRRLRHV